MNITGKEIVSASNIKALWDKLFSDTKIAQKLRKNMGLGDTLGPLEPKYGGLGMTVNPSILNPALGWKFPPKKSIKTDYQTKGSPIGGGTIGNKYYTCFKNEYMNAPVIVTVSDNGVTTEEKLVELTHSATNRTGYFVDDYSSNGDTFIMGKHHNICALYSYTSSGVKSVLFNKTFDNNSFIPTVDKNGSAFILEEASSSGVIRYTYIKKGAPEKKVTFSGVKNFTTTADTNVSLLENMVWLSVKNTSVSSGNAVVASIDLDAQRIEEIANLRYRQTNFIRTPNNIYIFARDVRDATDPLIGFRMNEHDIGPSFIAPITKQNEVMMQFLLSGSAPSGKDIGILPCGNIAIDSTSMVFCFMPYNNEISFYGIGNEIMNIEAEYRNSSNKLTINISSVEKL